MITLSAYDCVEVDGYLYFFSRDYNFIFKLELAGGDISIVDSIPEENLFASRLCSKIINYMGCLYIVPMNSEAIWRYSLVDNTWKKYKLRKLAGYRGKLAFLQAFVYKEKIFLLGSQYPAIVVIDPKSDDIQYVENIYTKSFKEMSDRLKDIFFGKDCVLIENQLYMASALSNSVLKFNMDTFEYEYVLVGGKNNRYSGISYDGDCFYLSPRRKTDVVKWDGAKSSESINVKYLKQGDAVVFSGIFSDVNSVFLYGNSLKENCLLENDIQDMKVRLLLETCWFCEMTNDETYMSLSCSGDLTVRKKDEEKKYRLQLEEDVIIEYIRKIFMNKEDHLSCLAENIVNEVMLEGNLVSLRMLMGMI